MKKYRVGVIGAGLQAERRIPEIVKDTDCELVVVSAKTKKEAERLAVQFSIESAVGYEPVAGRKDLDIILVLTPPDTHASATVLALNNGAHVLCEKPFANSVAEAMQMVKTAQKARRVLKCGFNHRHHPGIAQIKKWITEGKIGEVISVRGRYGIMGRPGIEKEWRSNPKIISGGQLLDQGIHLIDLYRWMVGEIKIVSAITATNYWPIKLEDNAQVVMQFANGATGNLHSSTTQWKNLFNIEVYGQRGYVSVEGLGGGYGTEIARLGTKDYNGPFKELKVEYRRGDISWGAEWQEFMQAIKNRKKPLGDGVDGLRSIEVAMAAYQSAKIGKTQKVNYKPLK